VSESLLNRFCTYKFIKCHGTVRLLRTGIDNDCAGICCHLVLIPAPDPNIFFASMYLLHVCSSAPQPIPRKEKTPSTSHPLDYVCTIVGLRLLYLSVVAFPEGVAQPSSFCHFVQSTSHPCPHARSLAFHLPHCPSPKTDCCT
jgi:hypothetical protein